VKPLQLHHPLIFPINHFHFSVAALERHNDAGEVFAKECEVRTRIALTEERNRKQLYTPPRFTANISELFAFFPLNPEIVEDTLLDNPEILKYDGGTAVEFIKILVECGDFELITQEEAFLFVTRIPEILKVDITKFKEQVSNLFGLTALYDIPWNKVMLASPQTLSLDPQHVSHVVEEIAAYFHSDNVRDVIGNNPEVLEIIWYDTKAKIKYLQKTMNVSAHRIAMTPKSLTQDLEFFKLRYQFLLRSGNYRHPDPSAKSALPVESSPALHLITDTDDSRFVYKCCPGLSLEEFNIFKTLLLLEDTGSLEDQELGGEEVEEDYNDDDARHNTYTRQTKKTTKMRQEGKQNRHKAT